MPQTNTSNVSVREIPYKTTEMSDLIYGFWRKKWFIVLSTIFAFFWGGYYAFVVATPVYESATVVILETDKEQIISFQSMPNTITGDTVEAVSEVEKLRARSLMQEVVQRLDLMNDPEFNRTLTPPSRKVVVKSKIKQELGWSTPEPKLPEAVHDQRTMDLVVSRLLGKIRVTNLRKSNVFRISVRTTEAIKSAQIATAIAEIYIQNQVKRKISEAKNATAWLRKRVDELQIELEHAETKASDFSASTELVSVEELQQKKIQLKDVRARISSAQEAKQSITDLLKKMRESDDNAEKVAVTNDDILRLLQEDQSQQAAFDVRFNRLFREKVIEYKELEQQLKSLNASAIELSTQITERGQDLIKLKQLNRESEATRVLYEHFLTRLKETASQEGIQSSDSRVLSPALIPYRPTEPRKSLIVTISGIAGLSFSILLVLIWEISRQNFLSLRTLALYSGYPGMAQFPYIQPKDRADFLDDLNHKPDNLYANAIRDVRTNLIIHDNQDISKIISVTSCFKEESTSAVSLMLAWDMARIGYKVLLIDTHVGTGGLRDYFGDSPTRGIISVLKGKHEIIQAVHHPTSLGGDILFLEDPNVIAGDVILPRTFNSLVETLKNEYDYNYVIINTASLKTSPTSRVILKYADAVIINVEWKKTTKNQIDETLNMLEYVKSSVAGVVLSGFPFGQER